MARGVKAGWNGGISGVAGFCPELMVRLYRRVVRGETSETGPLPLPVTPRRRQQIEAFHAWFQPWLRTIC